MFEKSTSDARPLERDHETHRCLAGRACRAADYTEDPETGLITRQGAHTTRPDSLCDSCTHAVEHAIDDMTETWIALHVSLGDQSRRTGQRVAASRNPPINLNTDIDATKAAIVEWLVAAAAPIAEQLNTADPHPRNSSDTQHAAAVLACTRILKPHVAELLALPPDDVTVWLTASETEYPGERKYVDDQGVTHCGTGIRTMNGAEIALQLVELRHRARKLLALTNPHDSLTLPCPSCGQYELVRRHEYRGSREIDQIDCGACNLSWPYERYRQLCLIWVKEDEMEREKLQKQLDTERKRREMAEWLLAKREWEFSLALDCPDVSAAEFAATVLASTAPDNDAYMSDKDIAAYVGVSDSTVRAWASRGHITRHTAEDGSTMFLAREVWEYATTNANGRASTVRRLTNQRRATAS